MRAYACECFGLIVDWLDHALCEDRRGALLRLCELRDGGFETMIRRSAQDREKEKNGPQGPETPEQEPATDGGAGES